MPPSGVAGPLVVGHAAVAEGNVEHAVGPESDVAAVVVELWLLDPHQHPRAAGVDHRARPLGILDPPLADHAQAGVVCPGLAVGQGSEVGRPGVERLRGVGVDQAVPPVVGMEGQTEQAPLVEAARTEGSERYQQVGPVRADVEEGERVGHTAVLVRLELDRGDGADLVDHEELFVVARCVDAQHRRGEAVGHELQLELGIADRDLLRYRIGVFGQGR